MPKQPREAVQGAAGPPSRERRCPIPPRRRARTPNPTTRRLFRCQGSRWRISEAPVQHRCGARTRAAARSLQTPQEQPTWQLWPPKDALRAARERRALPRGSIRYWYRYRALPTRERPSAPPVCRAIAQDLVCCRERGAAARNQHLLRRCAVSTAQEKQRALALGRDHASCGR